MPRMLRTGSAKFPLSRLYVRSGFKIMRGLRKAPCAGGQVMKFLRLVDATAYLDVTEYYINDVERIVGIIVSMLRAE